MERLANSAFQHSFQSIWMSLIRPPRRSYTDFELGPAEFQCEGCRVKRSKIEVVHPRKKELIVGSFYELAKKKEAGEIKYCVIYLHGNSGCQLNAFEIIKYFLPLNIAVFSFDFPGCGNSEGEFISLGHYEAEYAAFMMEHVRKLKDVQSFSLWGRSMGAVVALKLGIRKELGIKSLVLDSPFFSLKELCWELFKLHATDVRLVFLFLWKILRKKIMSLHGFDLNEIDLLKDIESKPGRPPVMFIAGLGDDFVKKHHSEKLCEKYGADCSKSVCFAEGDHNSERPRNILNKASLFVYNLFKSKDGKVEDRSPEKNSPKEGGFSQFFDASKERAAEMARLERILKEFGNSLESTTTLKGSSPSTFLKHTYSQFFCDLGEDSNNKEYLETCLSSNESLEGSCEAKFKSSPGIKTNMPGVTEISTAKGTLADAEEGSLSSFEELCDVD